MQIQNNIPLCRFSTLQIGGPARYFAEPVDRQELVALMRFHTEEAVPMFVVGRGSNLLFADEGYPGLVISLRKFEPERVHFDKRGFVRASAGTSLFRLSALCQTEGASGLEFTCHIPGTVGGAVAMNAGFGRAGRPYQEIKDVIHSLTVLDMEGRLRTLEKNDVQFGYRTSNLPSGIVVDATFQVARSTTEAVRAEVKANFAYRNSVQDLRYPSAGSVFKNPRSGNMTSGQLIDKVGLKGIRVGGAMISERHGNFILNADHAKAVDVLALIDLARARVRDEFGIELETEVKIIMPEPSSQGLETAVAV